MLQHRSTAEAQLLSVVRVSALSGAVDSTTVAITCTEKTGALGFDRSRLEADPRRRRPHSQWDRGHNDPGDEALAAASSPRHCHHRTRLTPPYLPAAC